MSKLFSANVRIVLVNTTHPGNIGAVARAMKNMDLTQLCLVKPEIFPHPDASARAAGADDILTNAIMVPSLDEALADCGLVIGTSARTRSLPWPILSLREAASQIIQEAQQTQVAIVFGQERMGLTNDELQRCNYLIHIPSNPEYSSLNLAAAVQIVAYEIYVALGNQEQTSAALFEIATADENKRFYDHLEQTLLAINFVNMNNKDSMLRRLHRLFNRTRLEKNEVNILRGILTEINKKIRS